MIDFQPGDIVTWKYAGRYDWAVEGERLVVLNKPAPEGLVYVSGGSLHSEHETIHQDHLILLDRPVVPEAAPAADVPTVITGTTTKMAWPD